MYGSNCHRSHCFGVKILRNHFASELSQCHVFHLLDASSYTTAPKSVATAKTLKKFSEAAEADREPFGAAQ